MVDNASDPVEIADVFAAKYESLYSSVSYDETDMKQLQEEIDILIRSESGMNGTCLPSHSISCEKVNFAISHLKCGKHDGDLGCYSDHIIHGTNRLNTYISLLFTAMLKHGFSPKSFSNIAMHPIPKNKRKSLNDSENYRGIALSSILGKILDWIILNDNFEILNSSELQFGFKPNSSTTQCSFVLTECLHYYKSHGSNVHLVFVDASKPFDSVEYVKLFRLLLKRNICPLVIRLLLNMYINQSISIVWGNAISKPFRCYNGVKQGGVLSPILFSIYLDELLMKLQKSSIGCHIGHILCQKRACFLYGST